jgi:hypothetical protein
MTRCRHCRSLPCRCAARGLLFLLAITLLLQLLIVLLAAAQDGGEIGTGLPASSMGRLLPPAVGMTGDPPPAKFIHPKSRIALGHPYGVTIPIQAWIERHPDHRLFEIQWARAGEAPMRFSKTVDGEKEARVFPDAAPLKVRLDYGLWTITVLGCTAHVHAVCTRARVRATTTIAICGGEFPCGGNQW